MRPINHEGDRRFAVALSFPGEHRDYVRQVNMALCKKKTLNQTRVFFDEFFEAEIAGFSADTILQRYYHDQAELIVVFLSKEYEQKEWCCNVEWRAIRDLIKTRHDRSILPLCFDRSNIQGIFSIDIIPDISKRTPKQTAELIYERLLIVRGETHRPRRHMPEKYLGKLHAIPKLPHQFFERPTCFAQIKDAILQTVQKPVGLIGAGAQIGVQGMGGVGKTVLATAVAYDEDIRQAFPDGIFWLTIGLDPRESFIVERQRQLARSLGAGAVADFTDIQGGKASLESSLQDRSCLVILDDVWEPQHASAFNVLGPKGRLLITTRIAQVINDLNATHIPIDLLTEFEARGLLAKYSDQNPQDMPEEASEVIEECGYLALALAMVGAMVKLRTDKTRAWSDVLEHLRKAELEDIKSHFPDYPYPHLLKAIKVSVDDLGQSNAQRYLDFAIFPEKQTIPEVTLETLWVHYGMSGPHARQLLQRLVDRSLARKNDKGRIYLHDLQYDYVRKIVSDQPGGIKARHERLLQAYANLCGPMGWPFGQNDDYYFQCLTWHLSQARHEDELKQLLWDPTWYRAKLEHTDVYELIQDFSLCAQDKALRLVKDAIYLSAHVLRIDPNQLSSQIYGRLLSREESSIQTLLQNIAKTRPGFWLRSLAPVLTQAGGPLLFTLAGHIDSVNDVALTPDGKQAISASTDKTLRVWDVATGKPLAIMKGHAQSVGIVVLTNDGRKAVSASEDKTLRVWDVTTGKPLAIIKGHEQPVEVLVLTTDGKKAVSASGDKTLRVWDIATGKTITIMKGHTRSITAVVLTTEGKAITASEDKTIKVWDIATGDLISTMRGHKDWVRAVFVTTDGRKAVSASWDNTLRVWDISTGETINVMKGYTEEIKLVALTPDCLKAVSAHEKTLRVWNIVTGKSISAMAGHTGSITAMAMMPDGKQIISASDDHTLRVWDMTTGKTITAMAGHYGSVNAVAITPDGKQVISASEDSTLKVWDVAKGMYLATLAKHTSSVNAVVVTPDGRKAVSASEDNTLRVWDMLTGKTLATLEGHTRSVNDVAMMPNGKQIISASSDHTLKVWDLTTYKLLATMKGSESFKIITLTTDGNKVVSASSWRDPLRVWDIFTGKILTSIEGHTESINSVNVTPDGRKVISSSNDGKIRVWDIFTGKNLAIMDGHAGPINALAMTPDGRMAISISRDSTLRLWDIATCKLLTVLEGHTGEVNTITVMPDGRKAVSTSRDDGSLRLWDLATGNLLKVLKGNTNLIFSATVMPDQQIVSSSFDNTLRVWDLTLGKELGSFTADFRIQCCAVSPDGRTLIASDEGGYVHILKVEIPLKGRLKSNGQYI